GTAAPLPLVKKILLNLLFLQGKEINIESGEEPGKCIHEYRENNYEKYINSPKPWNIYPDGTLRNYDSLDSTPLLLIAIHKYWKISGDEEFIATALPNVELALGWMATFADSNNDGFLDYRPHPERICGG